MKPKPASYFMPSCTKLAALAETAPNDTELAESAKKRHATPENHTIPASTGVPGMFRKPWPRPDDGKWENLFSKLLEIVDGAGIAVLVGNRGVGKTRLACEVVRERHGRGDSRPRYELAMMFFVRLRDTYRGKSDTSELEIIEEMCSAPLLVIDDFHERSESAWENRILNLVIDRRYSAPRPTIIVSNFSPSEMVKSLGPSAVDRINERGGIIEMIGKTHRGANQ